MISHFRIRAPFRLLRMILLGLAAVVGPSTLSAQSFPHRIADLQRVPQVDRIASNPDLTLLTSLNRQMPAWANAENQTSDRAIDLGSKIRISIVLKRDPAAQAALEQLLENQQDPGSALYHQWITPQQLGKLFGPTQNDLAAVSSWLMRQGLTVDSVEPNGVTVEASGTAAVVGNAFHTSFGSFRVGVGSRLSTMSAPSIPSALTPLIRSVNGLTETRYEPQSRVSTREATSAGLKPLVTLSGGTHAMLPDDFAVIYDIASVYNGGNKGATLGSAAQHVAVIGRSRVVAADIANFESLAGLPSIQPTVVLAGADPGIASGTNIGDASEATLDVDRVIGTSPGAQTDLVISAKSATQDGIDIAISYNINTLKDPVMTISFGSCEAANGSAETDVLNTEFETAASEGISTFVSSGDAGVAGCDTPFTPVTTAETPQVASINVICSSGYVTCVGGTQFNDTSNPAAYWTSTNSSPGNESALSYIPEGVWNEPSSTSSKGVTTYAPAAGGGGVSAFIAKPAWQKGLGVPTDGFRDVPDVSFSGADHDGYLGCFAAGGGSCVATPPSTSYSVEIFSGTSASAPSMAGIMALLNTKLGSKQGNVNPLLYGLAASHPAVFHDVTVASSGVSGCTAATPSMCNNSTPGPTSLSGGLAGFVATAGFDKATGLGSIDVANLLANATTTTSTLVSTSLALTAAANPITAGQATTFTATLTPSSTSAGMPSGTVQFYSNGTAFGSSVTISGNVATSASHTFSTAGTYAITAVYSGDTVFATSTSAAVSLVVNAVVTPGSFTLAAAPATLSVTPTLNTTPTSLSVITATSANGFVGAVALTCAVTPASTQPPTCAMSPASVTLASGGSATSTLTITSMGGTSSCTTATAERPEWFGGSAGIVFAGLLLLILPSRKRRSLRTLAMALMLASSLAVLSGCGGSTTTAVCSQVVKGGTTAGTYTVTVTGKNSSLTATVPVTITVN